MSASPSPISSSVENSLRLACPASLLADVERLAEVEAAELRLRARHARQQRQREQHSFSSTLFLRNSRSDTAASLPSRAKRSAAACPLDTTAPSRAPRHRGSRSSGPRARGRGCRWSRWWPVWPVCARRRARRQAGKKRVARRGGTFSTAAGKRRWNTRTQPLCPPASTRVQPPPRARTFTAVFSGSVATVRASLRAAVLELGRAIGERLLLGPGGGGELARAMARARVRSFMRE